jgi:hypothetical protein
VSQFCVRYTADKVPAQTSAATGVQLPSPHTSVVLAVVVSYRWSRRMYLWRLSHIILEGQNVDTGKAGALSRFWNALSVLFLALICVLMLGAVIARSRGPHIARRVRVRR